MTFQRLKESYVNELLGRNIEWVDILVILFDDKFNEFLKKLRFNCSREIFYQAKRPSINDLLLNLKLCVDCAEGNQLFQHKREIMTSSN
jgi:hypothetical protein